MPTNYTPVPSNAPATITVPSDLDDADAESVNLAFRAIADNLMGLAALKAASNVFTESGQEVSNNDAFNAAWTVSKDAGNDSHGGNLWKSILEAKVASTDGHMRLYTGKGVATGQVILVFNAKWDTAAQRWFPDDIGFASIGLQYEVAVGLRLSRRAAGAGTWTDWAAQTTGSFVAQGDLVCNGEAVSATGFRHSVLISRIFTVGVGAWSGFAVSNGTGQAAIAVQLTEHPILAIRLPPGSTLGVVEVMVQKFSSGTVTADAVRQAGLDWTTPDFAAANILDTDSSSGSVSGGRYLLSVDFGGLTTNETDTYHVVITPPTGGGAANGDVFIRSARIHCAVSRPLDH